MAQRLIRATLWLLRTIATWRTRAGDGQACYVKAAASDMRVAGDACDDCHAIEVFAAPLTTGLHRGYLSGLDCVGRFVVLKTDVQGYEEQVLRGLGNSLAEIDIIFPESNWISRSSIEIALELCEKALEWLPVNDVLWGADLCLLVSPQAASLNAKT